MSRNGRKNSSKGKSAESSGPGWEIIYTGFILIMLCFFIMLCTFATIEKSKVEHFVASFTRAVSVLPAGVKVGPGEQASLARLDIADDKGEMSLIFQELQKAASELGMEEDLTFSVFRNGLVVSLSDTALFDIGVAEISQRAFPMLEKIGEIISNTSHLVRIEGHTDDVPIHTYRFPSNWELSTARAVNVLRYFLDIYEIPTERLSAAGFGEFQPMVPNESPELRSKNRRVEVTFALKKDYVAVNETQKGLSQK